MKGQQAGNQCCQTNIEACLLFAQKAETQIFSNDQGRYKRNDNTCINTASIGIVPALEGSATRISPIEKILWQWLCLEA